MKRIGLWLRILILIVVSSGVAALTNAVRPDGLDWVINPQKSLNPGENPQLAENASITLDELREYLLYGTASIVDARKPEEYAAGHLSTAINIPSTEKEMYLDRIYELLPPEGLIIIYCEGGECESSHEVFEFLALSGFAVDDLKIYEPGWEVLGQQSDLPIVEEESE